VSTHFAGVVLAQHLWRQFYHLKSAGVKQKFVTVLCCFGTTPPAPILPPQACRCQAIFCNSLCSPHRRGAGGSGCTLTWRTKPVHACTIAVQIAPVWCSTGDPAPVQKLPKSWNKCPAPVQKLPKSYTSAAPIIQCEIDLVKRIFSGLTLNHSKPPDEKNPQQVRIWGLIWDNWE